MWSLWPQFKNILFSWINSTLKQLGPNITWKENSLKYAVLSLDMFQNCTLFLAAKHCKKLFRHQRLKTTKIKAKTFWKLDGSYRLTGKEFMKKYLHRVLEGFGTFTEFVVLNQLVLGQIVHVVVPADFKALLHKMDCSALKICGILSENSKLECLV